MNLTFRKKLEMAKKKSILGQILKRNPKNNKPNKKLVLNPFSVTDNYSKKQ